MAGKNELQIMSNFKASKPCEKFFESYATELTIDEFVALLVLCHSECNHQVITLGAIYAKHSFRLEVIISVSIMYGQWQDKMRDSRGILPDS